ncbi:hypothetical protein L6452_09114 [Arctium lappa]|uniref:Uncharacterized protein n=1 Tax=Arctium lappa TaxID=4217 RepID=A0ACB9DJK7_ARCLA|nr:hypothetical protein L6452_09114 [Arctium lappa]
MVDGFRTTLPNPSLSSLSWAPKKESKNKQNTRKKTPHHTQLKTISPTHFTQSLFTNTHCNWEIQKL